MTGLLFFDTNILIYAMDQMETEKRRIAIDCITLALEREAFVISPQVINEAYVVAKKRFPAVPREAARSFLRRFLPNCYAPYDTETIELAWRLEAEFGYSLWDCLLLASAQQSECTWFVTEDLQNAQRVRSLTIVNPFKTPFSAFLPVQ